MNRTALKEASLEAALVGITMLIVAMAYAAVRSAGLVWDDHVLIEQNPAVIGPWRSVFGPLFPPSPLIDAQAPYFRPLVAASLRLGAHHSFNVALHLANVALVVRLARVRGANVLPACALGFVWGVFPRSTEAVAWVSGRSDLLATFFCLSALIVWPFQSQKSRARLAFAALLIFGALCGKETAWCIPAAILAAPIVMWRAPSLAATVAVLLPVVAYGALRVSAVGVASLPARDVPWLTHVGSVLEAMGRYAEMMFDGFHPSASIGSALIVSTPYAIGGAGVLGLSLVLAVVTLRRADRVPNALFIQFLAIAACFASVVQIVPVNLAGAIVSDRYLYLPSALVLSVAGALLARVPARIEIVVSVAIALLGVAYWKPTVTRTRLYTDELAFFVSMANDAHPKNPTPRTALAQILRQHNAEDLACPLYDEAKRTLEETGREGSRSYRRVVENQCACDLRFERMDAARRCATDFARRYSTFARAPMRLGYVRLHDADFDGARAAFVEAKTLDPALGPHVPIDALIDLAEKGWLLLKAEPGHSRPGAADRGRIFALLGRRRDATEAWLGALESSDLGVADRLEGLVFLSRQGESDVSSAEIRRLAKGSTNPELNALLDQRDQAADRAALAVMALKPLRAR